MPLTFNKDQKRPLTLQHFERAWIPERLRGASLASIPSAAPYKRDLIRYLDNIEKFIKDGTGIVFGGAHGSGKSGSSIIVASEVLARGGSVLFLEESLLIEAIIEKIEFSEEYSVRERAESVDLLIIDDVGLSAQSTNMHIMETLVKYRIHRRKAVILTTNLTQSEFASRYKTITDALNEASIPIVCDGVAWREQLKKKLHSEFDA